MRSIDVIDENDEIKKKPGEKKRLQTLDKKTLPTFAMNPTIIFAYVGCLIPKFV